MKKLIQILAFCIAVISPVTNANAQDLSLYKLDTILVNYSLDPDIGLFVRGFQSEISSCLGFAREVLTKNTDLQIDIILQSHQFVGMSEAEAFTAFQSQVKIRKILANGNYEMIGEEGLELDLVTRDSLFVIIKRQAEKRNLAFDSTRIVAAIEEDSIFNAIRWYQYTHKTLVVGPDKNSAIELHDNILALLQSSRRSDAEQLYHLNLLMSDARSEIIIARMIALMKKNKIKKAVLVIGFLHEKKILEILEQLSIQYTIYRSE